MLNPHAGNPHTSQAAAHGNQETSMPPPMASPAPAPVVAPAAAPAAEANDELMKAAALLATLDQPAASAAPSTTPAQAAPPAGAMRRLQFHAAPPAPEAAPPPTVPATTGNFATATDAAKAAWLAKVDGVGTESFRDGPLRPDRTFIGTGSFNAMRRSFGGRAGD